LYRPYTFYLQRNTAELLRNVNLDAHDVIGGGLLPLLLLAMEGLTVSAILLLLFWVEPVTSVAAFLILGGATALFLRLLRRQTVRHGEQMHVSRLQMIQIVNEGLGGIKVTRVMGRERAFLDAFRRAAGAYAQSGRIRQVLIDSPRLFLETVGVAGLLVVAGALLLRGRTAITLIPTLALLAVAVARLIPSFNRITNALSIMRYGQSALDAVYKDLRDAENRPTPPSTSPLQFRNSISLDGVTFQYPGVSDPTLEDISLTIPKGSTVGIVGPTGSGKTTLIDVILGLLEPNQGSVLVDGMTIQGRERAWQRQVGYVPQDVYLSDDSIRRNVAFGLSDEEIEDEAVWRALEAAQAREFVERLPDRFNTVVGERGVRLSGGERQRIGIARALYHNPLVIVLDEATSALDHDTERAVMDAVDNLRSTHTILVIAHRLSTIDRCDYRLGLKGGQIAVKEHAATVPLPLIGTS
jgi:ATP-binding cassette subfamily C protein